MHWQPLLFTFFGDDSTMTCCCKTSRFASGD